MSERRLGFSFARQARDLVPMLALWGIGAFVLVVAGLQTEAPLRVLFLDAAHVTGNPWYLGLLSQVGILCWSVAATAAAGASWVAFSTMRPSAGRFLRAGAVATFILLADDLLQVHSAWIPRLGVSKLVAQGFIVLPTVIWLFMYWRELARTRWALVAASLCCFFVSLAVDSGLALEGSASLMVEDGGKFLGVLAWAQYFVLTAKDIARSTILAAMGRDLGGAARTTDADTSGRALRASESAPR